MEKRIKCWVVYSDDYPGGMIYQNRNDALEDSAETRSEGNEAYVRVKYFTKEELEAFPED